MERLQNLRHQAGTMVERAKIAYERRRSPLWAKSIEEFLTMADTSDGSLVTVFPGVRQLGYTYDRDRTREEYRGMGMNCPPFVTEFRITGWEFATVYEGATPLKRKIRHNHVLGTRDREDFYPVGTGGTSPYSYRLDNSEYFSEAIRNAQKMHKQYPKAKFMVYGWDGFKDYYYYAEGFHLASRREALP